jgi:hypothetical protein
MNEEDIQFLMEAVINMGKAHNHAWGIKEENLAKILDLIDAYGSDVVDAYIQQIKDLLK